MKTKTTNKKPSFSHDSFFKDFYSDPMLIQELLKLIFSKKEIESYNLKKLKIEKDTFKGKRADLVLSVPFKASPKIRLRIFILLEHKSSYDKYLFDQFLDYQVLMRKEIIKQTGYPQPIITLLFYHGKGPMKWKKSLQEEDFKDFFSKIPVESRKNMLNYKPRIINTQDPKIRKAYKGRKFKGYGIIKLLSEIWNLKKSSPLKVKKIFHDFEDIKKGLTDKRKVEINLRIFQYLLDNRVLDLKTWKKVEALLIKEGILTKGGIMSIRELIKEQGRWEGQREGLKKGRQEGLREGRQEGRQEGQQKGRQEGRQERNKEVILNMLKEKTDIAFISKVTGLSAKAIQKLKNGS